MKSHLLIVLPLSVPHPTVLGNIDKKCAVAFFEIDVKRFAAQEIGKIKYKEPSKFPEIEIDLTFVTNTFAPVRDAIKAANCPLIKGVDVVDTYADESGKTITVRILFSHPERTLTKEEVNAVAGDIAKALAEQGINMKTE